MISMYADPVRESKKGKALRTLTSMQVPPIALPVITGDRAAYGGTEGVVARHLEGLNANGNRTYVAATGDSDLENYAVKLITLSEHAWKEKDGKRDSVDLRRLGREYEHHYNMALQYANLLNVDVIHDHPGDFLVSSQAYLRGINKVIQPIIVTLHNNPEVNDRLKYAHWNALKRAGRNIHFYAISESQKRGWENAGVEVSGVVYNGIQAEKFPLVQDKQDYLFWIGRICEDKGTDVAIKSARQSGLPLIIAGEIREQDFYKQKIEPYLTGNFNGRKDEESLKNGLVEKLLDGDRIANPGEIVFVGSLNERQKVPFYQNSKALLVPNCWDEPFGLVMPEAMKTGTPVIGTDRGSIPEIVIDGRTGYLVPAARDEEDKTRLATDIVYAINNLGRINPRDCCDNVLQRFTKERMTEGYLVEYLKHLN